MVPARRKIIAIVGILLILGVLVVYKFKTNLFAPTKTPEVVTSEDLHYHAGFVVFNDGKKVDFSDMKYMVLKPCETEQHENNKTAADIQIDKAHLHDGVGDVVHVHTPGAVWSDLFTNLHYSIDYSKVTAYINGKRISDLKNAPIVANNSLVVFIGKVDESLLSQAVTLDHIKATESTSETCGN